MKLEHIKISAGEDEIFGTDAAERFHLSASKKNADLVVIHNFELGEDFLHYGKVNADGYTFDWIDFDEGGSADDLQITVGDQVFVLTDLGAQIDDPTEYRFDQGFETDADGILDADDVAGFGDITQVASGTDGVVSADGDFHAIVTQTGAGPFTRYGGYEGTYSGPWTTSVDIYLDATDDGGGWMAGEGFDFSSAANGSDGNHQRDYIFHVTQDTSTGELLINASNNTNFEPREDLDTLAGTAQIDEDGWYTFEHRFYDDGGALAVDLKVFDADGDEIFSKTLSDPGDLIPTEIGGNRYGWFTNIDVDGGVAIDNLQLSYDADQVLGLPAAEDIFFV